MPQKRDTVDQIVAKLRKADVELGKGKTHSSDLSAVAILFFIGGLREPTHPAMSHSILEFCARVPARRPELGPGSPS